MVSPASATRRSLLEEIAVSKGIRPDYEKYLSNFLNFAAANNLQRESRARTPFRELAPPLSQDPFDLSICSGLAEMMGAASGLEECAIYLCTLVVRYPRPGGGLSLVTET